MSDGQVPGAATGQDDLAFLRALEDCSLPPAQFNHRAHVRAAYLCLLQGDFAAALSRLRGAIRGFATHHGQPGRYHETVTVAYLALIQQHLCERGDGGGWPGFEAANPELFEPGLIGRYYSREELAAPAARRVFLLPRAAAAPTART